MLKGGRLIKNAVPLVQEVVEHPGTGDPQQPRGMGWISRDLHPSRPRSCNLG